MRRKQYRYKNRVNGVLWKCSKTKVKSPDLLGKIQLDDQLVEEVRKRLTTGAAPELQVAAWKATSLDGAEYFRLEVTPLFKGYVKEDQEPKMTRSLFDD